MPSFRVDCFEIIYWDPDPKKPDNPRDPTALKYFADVKRELDRIKASQAGRILIDCLSFHKKTIYIMHPDEDRCNAVEEKIGDNQSMVMFSPAFLSKCSAELPATDRSSTLPHERLHHELVHALRRVSKKNNPRRISGQRLPAFGDTEEFIAIMATNIFISDVSNRHKTSMRGAWINHPKLEAEHDQSFTFYSLDVGVYPIMESFCDENRGYAGMLSQVRAHFNPVAAFIKNPRKCFEIYAAAMDDDVWDQLWVNHLTKGMVPLKGPSTDN